MPVESGGVRGVARCDCVGVTRTEALLQQAQIPRRYQHCSFQNFHLRLENGQPNRSLSEARLVARRWVEEYPVDYGLLFIGPTGVGKTHLAGAVIRDLIMLKGVECRFQDFRELLKEIRDSYNPISESTEFRIIQPLVDVEVLLLDELAAFNPSEWVKETLSYLINSRYNRKKVTLITTTLPLGEPSRPSARTPSGEPMPDIDAALIHLGATLCSRLYEMCRPLEINCDDFRKQIRRQQIFADPDNP
jgi:DNA replication protein DnaC